MEHAAEGVQKVITDFGAFVPDGLCRHEPTGRGILNGRTFAVKDLIDIAGCRTGAGNPDWLAYQAPAARSAPVVEKALAAGAALVGKTVTDELAFSLEGRNIHYPSLTNPICPNRLPGGSSSGSAVAVAAGQVDFALGTDTGGSVRVPANFLGLFGFRPSHGVLPLDGVVPFAPSYDTVGWLSRDADMLVDVGTALLPEGKPVPITKLLLARDAFALADHELAQQLKARIASWRITGTITIFDGNETRYAECYRVLQGAEIWRSLGTWITDHNPRFAEDIAERFADAALIAPEDIANFHPVRAAFRTQLEALVPAGAGVVLPTTPCVAPLRSASPSVIGDFYQRALTLTSIAGHSGAPQVTFPLGLWRGCPIGVSILAAPGNDRALFDLVKGLATTEQEVASR
jgi:amidase